MKAYRLINGRPLLLLSVCLALGTGISYLVVFKGIPQSLCLLIFILLVFTYSKNKAQVLRRFLTIILAIALFFTGFFIFHKKASQLTRQIPPVGSARIEGTVIKTAQTDFGQAAVLSDIIINGQRCGYKLMLYIDGGDFSCGEIIGANAAVRLAYEKSSVAPLINGVLFKANAAAADIQSLGMSHDVFLKTKAKISAVLNANLDGQSAALGEAVLTGDTALMDADLLSSFRHGGIAHIFSVSGLHIATLAGALLLVFGKVKYRRFLKPALISAVLFLFSKVVGFSPSSVRASVMCTVFLFSKSLGLRRDSLNALLLAFIIVTLINPANLWDIGFLLSFSAVFFIIILNYPLSRFFGRLPRRVISPLCVSVAAGLGTLPIINDAFGYISLLSLILNLVFVPVISLCFTLLAAACFLTAVIAPFGFYLFFLPKVMLKFTAALFSWADLSAFTVKGLRFGLSSLFFYLCLSVLSDKLNLSRAWRGALTAVFAAAFCISFFYLNAAVI